MIGFTRKSSAERKEEIVEATLSLIGKKGIESLRTSEIAEKVGFSEAALYKHFPAKKEVIMATIRTAGEKLIRTLSTTANECESENELEKLRRVFETHLIFIRDNPGITRLLFSDEVHFNREDLRKELLSIINKYQEFVEGLIERGIKKGQMKKDLDIEAATTLYLGFIQSQILFWSLSGGEKLLNDKADSFWAIFRKLVESD